MPNNLNIHMMSRHDWKVEKFNPQQNAKLKLFGYKQSILEYFYQLCNGVLVDDWISPFMPRDMDLVAIAFYKVIMISNGFELKPSSVVNIIFFFFYNFMIFFLC